MAQKVFITNNNLATFICPQCEKTRTVDVSKYKNLAQAAKVKVKCSCGHAYSVELDKRKHYRRETSLTGVYIHIVSSLGTDFSEEVGKGIMTVQDLSRSGLRFKLNVAPTFAVGDKLLLEFRLDDKKRSLIKKEVSIRSIKGLIIGTEFTHLDPSDSSDRAIGFYLLN